MIGYGRNLLGKHLQIRLRDGDQASEKEAQEQNYLKFHGPGHLRADLLAHRGHGKLGA